jgi:hypothetical protein
VVSEVVELAEGLKAQTIEALVAESDQAVGLNWLLNVHDSQDSI